MINKINTFTSTGSKLLNHPEWIMAAKMYGVLKPISVQIAPTATCNLPCIFCSNRNRQKNEFLEYDVARNALARLKDLGAKTVEITGGGEPTLYGSLNELIRFAHKIGYEIGMITNGTGLKSLWKGTLDLLRWVRISMNVLEYRNEIFIPEIPENTTLGFSYVLNDMTTVNVVKRINDYVRKYNPEYVRIVPNCQTDEQTQNRNNARYSRMVAKWGHPYFYQAKVFEKPERCWWCFAKPFILHDGWVYPCSSVVLNDDSNQTFHEKFRWCKIEDLPQKYDRASEPFNPASCDHCVFTKQNNDVDSILTPSVMGNFV